MAKQVLIIDDDAGVAKAVGDACVALGDVEVSIAGTGAQGLALFKAGGFSLVLLDLLLPGGMDGGKVAEALRAVSPTVPIVVISGFLKDPKTQRDLETRFGVRAFLPKPIKLEALADTVWPFLGLVERPVSGERPVAAAAAPRKTVGAFTADLAELSVCRLFGELARGKAEGVLDLTRGNAKKRFYVQRGWFRYAASNVRAETLAGLLPQRGVPEAEVNAALAKAKAEGLTFTDALVARGAVPKGEVSGLLVLQTEEIAATALHWTDGQASFKPGRVDSGPEGRANPLVCVLKAVGRGPSAPAARAALTAQGEQVLERTAELERETFTLRNLFPGERLTPGINGRNTVAQLLARASDLDAQLLHALVASGLAQVRGAPPVSLGDARPPTAPGTPVFAPFEGARPSSRASLPPVKRHTPEEHEARKGIQTEAQRQQGALTHYQVLGVPVTADTAAIKSAYFDLARRFHTDSFSGLDLGDAQTALEDIFKRITEANRVLASDDERATYDLILDNQSKGLPTTVDQFLEAESSFGRAESSRKAGRLRDAEALYRQAVSLNGGQPNFLFRLAEIIVQLHGKEGSSEARVLLDKALAIKQDLLPAVLLNGRLLLESGDAKQALELARKLMGAQAGYPGAMELLKDAKSALTSGPISEEKSGLFGKLFGAKGK